MFFCCLSCLKMLSYAFSAEGEVDFEILHVLAFDSTRKRMSVVVRHPLTKEIVLYTKGADSAVLSVLARKYKGENFLYIPVEQIGRVFGDNWTIIIVGSP